MLAPAGFGHRFPCFARSLLAAAAFACVGLVAVNVEIQIVLGRATIPMQQLLRMGRGAVITLDAKAQDEVWILANNHPVARGEIQIQNDKIAISVTRAADVYDFMAGAS